MVNETNTEAPWYHGVKWYWSEDRFNGGFSGLFDVSTDDPVVYPQTRNDGDTGAAWFEEITDLHAALIATAPLVAAQRDGLFVECERLRRVAQFREDAHVKAATERDNLKQEVERLREALTNIAVEAESSPQSVVRDSLEQRIAHKARAALRTGG